MQMRVGAILAELAAQDRSLGDHFSYGKGERVLSAAIAFAMQIIAMSELTHQSRCTYSAFERVSGDTTEVRSAQPADSDRRVFVGTVEARRPRSFDNYPGHPIFLSQPLKVLALELLPRLLIPELLQPRDRKRWEH